MSTDDDLGIDPVQPLEPERDPGESPAMRVDEVRVQAAGSRDQAMRDQAMRDQAMRDRAVQPRPRRRRRAGPALAWLLLLALSAGLHLTRLGERSFHHDESIHAQAAYQLLHDGVYRYDPTYHGPLLYYLTAATFAIGGDSDTTARLPIALAGIALIGACWLLRRPLGGKAAWWTGLLVTISPLCLYYGRFLRMDILELLAASLTAIAMLRAVRGSERAWIWAGVAAAAALATKENAYVTLALIGVVWAAMAASLAMVRGWREVRGAGSNHVAQGEEGRPGIVRSAAFALGRAVVMPWIQLWRWSSKHSVGLAIAVAVCWLVVTPLYTVGLEYPGDWFFPGKAISYWYQQHTVQRVGGPVWYHLPRLAQYELLPIAAACLWCLRRGRRLTRLEVSLLLFGVASIGMYCYLGEKVAWLGVHQVWAFLPLAGMQLARTFGPKGRWWSRSLAVAALVATATITVVASFVTDEISPNLKRVETMVYVQTSPELRPVVDEGLALAREGASPVASVSGDATWPLSWYWRGIPVWWTEPTAGVRPPLVICDTHEVARIARLLGPGYSREEIPLRSWWLLNRRPTPRAVLRYLLTRVPWSGVGSTNVAVLRLAEEPESVRQEVGTPAELAAELGVERAWVVGRPWLMEPRGMAVAPRGMAVAPMAEGEPGSGQLAVADSSLSRTMRIDPDGAVHTMAFAVGLAQPEDVEWLADGRLVVADTWNHRVIELDPEDGGVVVRAAPAGGWYGPRSLSRGPDGSLVVADTGNKRLVIYDSKGKLVETRGSAGSGPGELDEPGGVVWLDDRRVLVCDTGNHRLQVLDQGGASVEQVSLPDAWHDYYARPQVVALAPDTWLATDTPGRCLWLVESGRVLKIALATSGMKPTGLAWSPPKLYIGDLNGWVWELDVSEQWQQEHGG